MFTTGAIRCRFCASEDGTLVLDLGEQPSPELFVPLQTPCRDPRIPVRL